MLYLKDFTQCSRHTPSQKVFPWLSRAASIDTCTPTAYLVEWKKCFRFSVFLMVLVCMWPGRRKNNTGEQQSWVTIVSGLYIYIYIYIYIYYQKGIFQKSIYLNVHLQMIFFSPIFLIYGLLR